MYLEALEISVDWNAYKNHSIKGFTDGLFGDDNSITMLSIVYLKNTRSESQLHVRN